MSSWKECKLGEVAEINMGQSPKSEFYNQDKIGLPFLQGNRTFGLKYPYFDTYCSEPTKIAKHGEILFSVRAPVGDINIANDEICIGRGLCSINSKDKNNEFLYYLLHFLKNEIINNESGSVFGSINRTDLSNINVLYPPIEEQKAIAEVLSGLDDKIDLLHRQNQTLESLAQTLFRQWFIEEVKEEWEIVTLGDLGKVITGKTPSTSNEDFWGEDVFFITPTDFKNYNKYAFSSDRKLSTIGKNKVKNSVLPKNSILVTCIGSDMGKVVITKNECVTNQQINSLVLSNDNLLNEYVFQYLKSIYPLLRAIALGGTTMPIINKTDFENIEILLPTDEVLEKFQSITLSSNQKIIENTKQIQTLENLRDTLLPKLLSGEVRVEI